MQVKKIGIIMKPFILLLTGLVLTLNLSAQNIINKQFALIDYNLEITDNFRDQTESLQNFYQSAQVHNEEAEDRLKAILVHDIYYNLKPRLERELQISILPVNSFMQEAKYDDFGYPKMSIRRALRKGDSPFYFNVNVELNSREAEEINQEDNTGPVVQPQFIVDIKVFNDEGILPVYKWHGEKMASRALPVSKTLFKGFVDELPGAQKTDTTLTFLYDEAVTTLINNHLND